MAFSAISAPAQHQKPQLIITRQSSSAVEDVSKNGIKKRVHVVVKNNPFLLQVTIANTIFPVKSIPLEAFLVYDDGNKDVDFVKVKPVEFKTSANEFDKGVLTMEVKIKVLSSQLEDSFFRIKVIALHPLTKQKLNGLVVYSEPIKCVSKPSQVLKPKPSLLDKVKTVSSAKRKSEELLEYLNYTLEKVEQQCDAQINALAHADLGFIPECKPEVHSEKQNNFELAFQQFMTAYGKLDADSRASKIRRFFGGMSAREQEQSSQLGSHLQENLKSERISAHADYLMPSSSFCQCDSCPHQVELTKFNTFYDAFLSGPAFIDE